MFPGETISFSFVIPFVAAELNHVIVSYGQKDGTILEHTVSSGFENQANLKCGFHDELTQEESLLFCDNDELIIQLNVFTVEDTRHTSKEIHVNTGRQWHREKVTAV